MTAPVFILFIYSEDIFILMGMDPDVSKEARIYLIYMIPGAIAMCQFETVRRFLQSMDIFYISMYIQFTTLVLHIAL